MRARALSSFLFKYLAPCVLPFAFNSGELPFQGSLCPSFSRSPSAFPESMSLRCSHPLCHSSPSFHRAPTTPCHFALLYNGRYSTLLPSGDDYLCLRAKREMKAKLFDSALRRLPTLAVSLLFRLFFSSVSLPLPFYISLSCPPSFYLPIFAVSLFLSISLSPLSSLFLLPARSLVFSHPSVTLAGSVSLSSLHARASFPSYRCAAAILLLPF